MALNILRSRVIATISSQRLLSTFGSPARFARCVTPRVSSSGLRSKELLISSACSVNQLQSRKFGYFGPDREPLDMDQVRSRVLSVVGKFEKIDAASVSILQIKCGPFHLQKRQYAAKAPLTYDFIRERVILVLQLYDKVDPEKVRSIWVNYRRSNAANFLSLDRTCHSLTPCICFFLSPSMSVVET